MSRRYAYPRNRDPAKGRQRPYQRYASRVLNKRALRAMALQAIGRPAVAQGPLHDALLEMYPDTYQAAIARAEEHANQTESNVWAVVFLLHRILPRNEFRIFHKNPFALIPWRKDLEQNLNRLRQPKRLEYRTGPYVVTYVARRR